MGRWEKRAFVCALVAAPACGPTDTVVDVPRERAGNEAQIEARRGRVVGGVPIDRTIAWPREEPDEQRRNALDDQARAAIDRSPVPILLPDVWWLETPHITLGSRWATLSFARDGLTLNLQASGRARVYPGIRGAEPSHRVRHLPGHVTSNEGIWSASWIESGVAYSLELECDDLRRPECADERTLLSIADGLGFGGGEQAL